MLRLSHLVLLQQSKGEELLMLEDDKVYNAWRKQIREECIKRHKRRPPLTSEFVRECVAMSDWDETPPANIALDRLVDLGLVPFA